MSIDLKELQAILLSLSSILARGLSLAQREEVLGDLPIKSNLTNTTDEFEIYDTLLGYYKSTNNLEFIANITIKIRATESFYQDVGAELDNLIYLLRKNDISIEGNQSGPYLFVLLPFEERFFSIYEAVIKPVAKELGCITKHAKDINKVDVIIDSIYTEIAKSDFLIADASERNPNVFYEIGYAHALRKKVIILVQNPKDIPFDIRGFRYIEYDPNSRNLLSETLRNFIKETIKEVQ